MQRVLFCGRSQWHVEPLMKVLMLNLWKGSISCSPGCEGEQTWNPTCWETQTRRIELAAAHGFSHQILLPYCHWASLGYVRGVASNMPPMRNVTLLQVVWLHFISVPFPLWMAKKPTASALRKVPCSGWWIGPPSAVPKLAQALKAVLQLLSHRKMALDGNHIPKYQNCFKIFVTCEILPNWLKFSKFILSIFKLTHLSNSFILSALVSVLPRKVLPCNRGGRCAAVLPCRSWRSPTRAWSTDVNCHRGHHGNEKWTKTQ